MYGPICANHKLRVHECMHCVCLHAHKKIDEKPHKPVGSKATSGEWYWSEGGSCSLSYKSKLLNCHGYVDTLKGKKQILKRTVILWRDMCV